MTILRSTMSALTMSVCLVLSTVACDDGDDDGEKETPKDTDNDAGDDSDTTATNDTEDAGEDDGTDTAEDTVLPASAEDTVFEETTEALSGIMTVSSYVDETAPDNMLTTAFYGFEADWNQITPDFCDRLGNRVSCPAIACDAENREATLSYETSFDGCEVKGCFFANKSVSGEVNLKRSGDGEGLVITFNAFHVGELTFNGVLEVQATGGVKSIAFSGDDSADCPGLHIENEDEYEACISGALAITPGDLTETEGVVEKRTVTLTDVSFSSEHHDVVLNGTLTWIDDLNCFGPQTGALTVSFESKEKNGENDPLIALSFEVTFDPDNRSSVLAAIQEMAVFADYETILPRGLFCSLPKIDDVTFSHGAIEDFQASAFAKKVMTEVVDDVTSTVKENPKVKAVRALTQGLTADDILARLSEVGDGKLIRFIQAPVKGLCMLEDTATCPSITVSCSAPSDSETEPTFFDCNDVDIDYPQGEENDPVPKTMILDFNGDDDNCTTSDGDKYGGKITVERSMENPLYLALTFDRFAVYSGEGDDEVANTLHGKLIGEVERTSEPCVQDNELLGTITLATPVFTDEGELGLAFQKGTCPASSIVLAPFKITLTDASDMPEGRDRAGESFFITVEQDGENYYVSTLAEHVPESCAEDDDWPDGSDDEDTDGVYYDLPVSCSCPLEGPVTLGTEAYVISLDYEGCVSLCTSLGDISTGLDTACENLCNTLITEENGTIEIGSAAMSLSLGFKTVCGDISVCESATLNSSEGTECLDRNGDQSSTPCATMISRTNTDDHRANCFEKCISESGIDSSGFAKTYFEAQFGDIDELLSELCVAL